MTVLITNKLFKFTSLFFIFCTLLAPVSFATIGGAGPGGGDVVAIEFKRLGFEISRTLRSQRVHTVGRIEIRQFESILQNVRVVSTTQRLQLDGLEKDAINYPDQNLVLVGRLRWDAYNLASKRQLVVHETLRFMHVEDGDDYSESLRLIQVFENLHRPNSATSTDASPLENQITIESVLVPGVKLESLRSFLIQDPLLPRGLRWNDSQGRDFFVRCDLTHRDPHATDLSPEAMGYRNTRIQYRAILEVASVTKGENVYAPVIGASRDYTVRFKRSPITLSCSTTMVADNDQTVEPFSVTLNQFNQIYSRFFRIIP